MRQGPPPTGRRARGRHHGGGNGGGHSNGGGNGGPPRVGMDNRPRSAASLRHQTFDSNCNDLRVRGNAWQVHEKYQALARDSQSAGDRVAAENFLQHAEHYFRIIEAINEATAIEQRQSGRPPGNPAFGSQPETPTNFYVGDPSQPGAPGQNAQQSEADGNNSQNQASQQGGQATAQAEVQVRQAPQSPFFTPEEIEGADGMQPLVAHR